MKQILFFFLFIASVHNIQAQLVAKATCGAFVVDILDGKVNGLKPNARWQEIRDKLPCFTASQPETDTTKCGANVFFKDKDIYFFTDRNYIEIGDKFPGKFSIPVMGSTRNSLFGTLGNPQIKDENWDAFQMAYGTLILRYNKANKVNLVQFSTEGPGTLHLCELSSR